jgi:hypothetical protein
MRPTILQLGFTGSKYPLPEIQQKNLSLLISELTGRYESVTVHHGDCVNGDETFHRLCAPRLVVRSIIVHPPTDPKLRAFCDGAKVTILDPLPYPVRNKEVVISSEVMIACPSSMTERIRSGTWQTVRMARKQHRIVHFVFPDGSTKKELNP